MSRKNQSSPRSLQRKEKRDAQQKTENTTNSAPAPTSVNKTAPERHIDSRLSILSAGLALWTFVNNFIKMVGAEDPLKRPVRRDGPIYHTTALPTDAPTQAPVITSTTTSTSTAITSAFQNITTTVANFLHNTTTTTSSSTSTTITTPPPFENPTNCTVPDLMRTVNSPKFLKYLELNNLTDPFFNSVDHIIHNVTDFGAHLSNLGNATVNVANQTLNATWELIRYINNNCKEAVTPKEDNKDGGFKWWQAVAGGIGGLVLIAAIYAAAKSRGAAVTTDGSLALADLDPELGAVGKKGKGKDARTTTTDFSTDPDADLLRLTPKRPPQTSVTNFKGQKVVTLAAQGKGSDSDSDSEDDQPTPGRDGSSRA